ncbi:hypothetical protein DE146DRAFT_634435 [Phaeosphaeria sp. MPI-PUGE-AT-0046c]|nr:hypothetical protein DE146DRAFT_634435 [Phaeosphaeria sp. MPI-PUGE-AT-0046c]
MKFTTLAFSLSLSSSLGLSQSIQLLNVTTAISGFTSSCVAVLNQAIACDASIKWAGGGRYEDDQTLSALCTTACTSGLSTWLRRVAGACTQRSLGPQGSSILPAFWIEKIIEQYSLACFKDSAGSKLCNAVLRDALGIDAKNQKQTKSPASTATCDDCFLKQIQTRLQMPLKSDPDLAKTFTSLTKQCSKTGYAVTTPASTQWILWGTSTPTVSSGNTPKPTGCQGTMYTVKSGDTCQSVSYANSVSTADLLMANNLQAFCANFPKSGNLCISKAAKCKVYTVKKGDTCASIGTANKLTWTQVVAWNPIFGDSCNSIDQFTGWTACISNPGGDWVNLHPTTPTPSTADIPTPTWIGTDASLLPQPTFGGMINGSDIWTFQYAPGTRLDCRTFANGTDFGNSAACADVAKGFGVSTQNLTDWNPSLLNNSCVLDGKLTYCVQALRLNATTFTPYCSATDVPDYGRKCDEFLALWGLSIENFAAWNDGVGSACENWVLVLADPCGVIETAYGLQHARFVAWNPAVGQNCTEMEAGYDYCVSIPGFKPKYSSYVPPWATISRKIPNLNAISSTAVKTASSTTGRTAVPVTGGVSTATKATSAKVSGTTRA